MKFLKFLLSLVFLVFSFTTFASDGINSGNKKFTPASRISPQDWTDSEELDRVWQASIVTIPLAAGRSIETTIGNLNSETINNGPHPTVVLVHGCGGIWPGTYRRMEVFARNGFAVVAPASFARVKYPKSCDIKNKTAGLYRGIVSLRKHDVRHAIRSVRKLPWVDNDNIFLVGHSEGAIIAATFDDPGSPVNARIVESWTCESSWSEYRGIKAPAGEPVLALLAKNDPWFSDFRGTGGCDKFLNRENGSRSIVFDQPDIQNRHGLLELETVQQIVFDFLTRRLK